MVKKSESGVLLEIKARVNGLDEIRNRLLDMGASRAGLYHQVDTYFDVPQGRL